ncbi:tol-pal system-associated acyl-CoA thioesterase [Palleronia caenipelagi]|uniref:Tol-pal system-associated acyl-CoA thioesterase n=1 Tax=Palleronia caenipelagi TaxID=2489174 RepID=A0A547Q5J4_9RHOB|nr:tol-pal system-associated acyl-CoA thioesterase [Palleronia caenipelagi]TRD21660.1 tol-pal system-associated acyl-CoA thioesterase [Palleronia caenipelagi]
MTHRFDVTVYYEDTDMGGIVYHANYLKFIERARSDWVRGLGVDQNMLRDGGLVFAVRRVEADFLGPARLDDRLEVETEVLSATGARIELGQKIRSGGKTLFRAKVQLVAMDPAGGVRRLPAELRARIA